ncbi:hypothetical protein Tco_0740283 [Tanacetum coccineum]
MAQQVIPTAQLVPQYKQIGRCNNYVVLQSILCSPECKIDGQILLDHSLSYALTATADVLAVYLQQFWRTVSKVPDTEDTIKFLLNTEQFIYIVDMFRDTLKLPVETPENPFVAPANIHTIEKFMNRVCYQGVVDKTKINILQLFYAVINRTNVDYAALLWWDFMNNVFQKKEAIQIEEDYHSVKDDIPLRFGKLMLFRRTNRNTPRAHRPPAVSTNPLETKKRKQTAGESSSLRRIIKKKKQPAPSIPPPGDDRERDAIAEATLLSLAIHKTALIAEAQENVAKVQEKLDEEEIDEMVEGNTDEESYASVFADSMLNDEGDDVDDTKSKIEPGSQKENPEHMPDDDEKEINVDNETEKEKEVKQANKEKENEEIGAEQDIVEKEVENETNVEAEKTDEVVKEKEVANVLGSQEIVGVCSCHNK